MVNLLGDLWADGEPDWEAALRSDPGVKLHLYGKRTAAAGRKMGHLTVLDPDPGAALARALDARRALAPRRRPRLRTPVAGAWGRRRMRLAEPAWLLLLALIPLPWLWERARARIAWPTLDGFRKAPAAGAGWPRHLPASLRGLALGALAVALARPQSVGGQARIAGRGVAIVVALDGSSSMAAVDFPAGTIQISRLEAAKETFAGSCGVGPTT
jgi:hypothetical protein